MIVTCCKIFDYFDAYGQIGKSLSKVKVMRQGETPKKDEANRWAVRVGRTRAEGVILVMCRRCYEGMESKDRLFTPSGGPGEG